MLWLKIILANKAVFWLNIEFSLSFIHLIHLAAFFSNIYILITIFHFKCRNSSSRPSSLASSKAWKSCGNKTVAILVIIARRETMIIVNHPIFSVMWYMHIRNVLNYHIPVSKCCYQITYALLFHSNNLLLFSRTEDFQIE